jgi:hypothetical protein
MAMANTLRESTQAIRISGFRNGGPTRGGIKQRSNRLHALVAAVAMIWRLRGNHHQAQPAIGAALRWISAITGIAGSNPASATITSDQFFPPG